MKKILALAALGVVALVSFAQAGPLVAPHMAFKALSFRTHIAAPTAAQLAYANSGYDNLGFYVDSLTQQSTGSVFDTTTSISTVGWAAAVPVGTALDSSLAYHVFFSDAGNSSTATDSLYIQEQVSPDGKNWQSAAQCLGTPVALAYLLNTTVNGTVTPMITIGGTSSVAKIWGLKVGRVPSVAQTNQRLTPDIWSSADWPFIRFIIRSVAGTGIFNGQGKIGYFSADEDLNK